MRRQQGRSGQKRRRPAWIQPLLVAALMAAGSLGLPAQAQPPDVGGLPSSSRIAEQAPQALPVAPGEVSTVRGTTTWHYPSGAEEVVRELQQIHGREWVRIAQDFGQRIDDRLTVRIARNPEEMRRLAPPRMPPPRYAVGVAYPQFGLILLTMSAPHTWEPPDLPKVFVHELSHIAMYRAVRGYRPPRWFVEGVAVYHAGENSLGRTRALWMATLTGDLVPLRRLSARFSDRAHRVDVAYAQSADFVTFLRAEETGHRAFHRLITQLGQGAPLGDAVAHAYGLSLTGMEVAWRDNLERRYTTIPLLLSGSGIWFLASFLLVVAWFRRRRRQRQRLQEMEAEEALEASFTMPAEPAPTVQAAPLAPSPQPRPSSVPPPVPEPGIPTYEYDGQHHTLH